MAIEVEMYEKIRHLHEHENMSQRSIMKIFGISRSFYFPKISLYIDFRVKRGLPIPVAIALNQS